MKLQCVQTRSKRFSRSDSGLETMIWPFAPAPRNQGIHASLLSAHSRVSMDYKKTHIFAASPEDIGYDMERARTMTISSNGVCEWDAVESRSF